MNTLEFIVGGSRPFTGAGRSHAGDRAVFPCTGAVNVHDVLEHVRQVVEAESALQLVRDYDPSLPMVEADRDMLVQALMNLVRNAAQAVAGSDGSVTVRTRVERKFTIRSKVHRLVVRIDINDTGPGIDPELADGIFLPMVSGRVNGSGLGLSIANSIIHRLDGAIAFDSIPGNTVFTVWLPADTSS